MLRAERSWDQLAEVYDRQLWLERRALAAALELAAVRRDELLLDVATGTGALLRLLAAAPGRPERVVGLDSSRAMLARVRGVPRSWQLAVGDASALPFEDGSFDVVTCTYLLHLLGRDSRLQVIAECRRVLEASGRLVTVTVAAPPTAAGKAAALPFALLRRIGPSSYPGLEPVDPRPDLEAAGFAVRRSRFRSLGYPSLCVLAAPARRLPTTCSRASPS